MVPARPASPLLILGADSQSGTYLLRIRVKEAQSLAFGRFRQGRTIPVPAGEYLYVGSALGGRLASRLLRHATRSAGLPPHPIRALMIPHFQRIGLGRPGLTTPRAKRRFWRIDYLLDSMTVDLVGVIALRSSQPLEAELARLLGADPAASPLAPGLGASDVPGNTHLLHLVADEDWWRSLAARLEALAAAPP